MVIQHSIMVISEEWYWKGHLVYILTDSRLKHMRTGASVIQSIRGCDQLQLDHVLS